MGEIVPTSDSPDRNIGEGPPNTKDRVWERDPKDDAPRLGTPPRTRGPGSRAVIDYVSRLSEEHKMLVALKAQLYAGSWDPMLDDLRNRLAGKPYIFKLVHRIQDDIERIKEMQKFEVEHKIDLAEYVDG